MTNEEQSIALSQDRKALRKRLNDARSCLRDDLRKKFPANGSKLDFERKRLISPDGKMALQWSVRKHPNHPVGYDGQQQTNAGSVEFMANT